MNKAIIKSIGIAIVIVFLCSLNKTNAQNVAITDDNSYTAHSTAMLDVKSISKGLLLPRLTMTQRDAITSPADGLMIFQTDNTAGVYVYESGWKLLGDNLGDHTATQNILLNGNWLSNDGDSEGLFVGSDGNVGIGTSSGTSALTVAGSIYGLHAETFFKMYDVGDWSKFIIGNTNTDNEGVSIYINGYDGDAAGSDYAGITHYGTSAENYRLTIGNNWGPVTFQENGGNVGIGTINPEAQMHIYDDTNDAFLRVESASSTDAAAIDFKAPGGFGEILFGGSSYADWGGVNTFAFVNVSDGPITFNHYQSGPKERMRITGAGYVGIGTSNPQEKFTVDGNIRMQSSGTARLVLSAETGYNSIFSYGGNHIVFSTAGHVGVGINNPGTRFQVYADGTENGNLDAISVNRPSTNVEANYYWMTGGISKWALSLDNDGTEDLDFYANGGINNFVMTLQHSTGNVGIGTINPNYGLHVNRNIANTDPTLKISNSAVPGGSGITLTGNNDAEASLIWLNGLTGDISFQTNTQTYLSSNIKMTIQKGGNVGIGTTSPSYKLTVAGGSAGISVSGGNDGDRLIEFNTDRPWYFEQEGDGAGTMLRLREYDAGSKSFFVDASGSFGVRSQDGSNYKFIVNSLGKIGIGTSSPNAYLQVDAPSTSGVNDTLFAVKDNAGNNVFVVYQDAVQVIVPPPAKGDKSNKRGSFVVSGRGGSKGIVNFMELTEDNYLIGHDVATGISTGLRNSILGYEAANSLSSGNDNVMIGYQAGNSTSSGSDNTFIGNNAGKLNQTNGNNVYIGDLAGWYTQGNYNVFIGSSAGSFKNSGNKNIMLGYYAGGGSLVKVSGCGDDNIFIGYRTGSNTGVSSSDNVFIGNQAGWYNSTGLRSIYIGKEAGYSSTNGEDNVYVGYYAGNSNTSGDYNTYIGQFAGGNGSTGYNNTYLGASAGEFATGHDNVFIGHNAGSSETGNYKLYIDNSATTSPLIYGDFNTPYVVINGNSSHRTGSLANAELIVYGQAGGYGAWINVSDKKVKKNIVTIDNALMKTLSLRGVYYDWKDPEKYEDGTQIGFIAQEVNEVIPEVVRTDGEDYAMQYAPITALLVEAIKEQQQQINEKESEIEKLKTQNKELNTRLQSIESYIQKQQNLSLNQ
jgi:hypothetical protein